MLLASALSDDAMRVLFPAKKDDARINSGPKNPSGFS